MKDNVKVLTLSDIFSAGNEYAEKTAGDIVAGVESRFKRVSTAKLGLGRSKPLGEPTPFQPKDPRTIPRRDWLYGRHLIRRHVSATIAAGAVGKTSLKIVEALAIASGKALLGKSVLKPLRVWLINLEDDQDEIDRRVMAAMTYYDLRPEHIDGRLFIDADKSLLITHTTREGTKVRSPVIDALVEAIERRKIDAVMVDPFVSTHDAPENDSGAMDRIVKAGWIPVARRGNCAVELVHHTTKSAAASGEANALSARGSGAVIFACRSVQVLNPMTVKQAEAAGVDNRHRYFCATDDKENLTVKSGTAAWYRMESVNLENAGSGNLAFLHADEVGVVTKWRWPSSTALVEEVQEDGLETIKERIRAGEFRAHPQAKDWAGHVVADVLTIDLEQAGEKRRVNKMILEWIKAGHFTIVKGRDAKREIKPFLVVNESAVLPDRENG